MKKSLFALAATTAIAGAAQAQSSVTVYGILDMGYIGSNAREVAGTSNGGGTQAVTKTTKSAFGNGAEQTSRLGFKGTEDLGGGSSAFFTVELGLTPQNSELSGGAARDPIQSTTQASGSAVDNRQSFVGFKKNGLGQFAFGRQYTTIFNAGAKTDPGQYNNIAGNVIYSSGSVYASADTVSSGTNNNIGFTNRASNQLSVDTATFAGFTGHAMYALNNQNATQTTSTGSTAGGGNTNWNGYGLGVDFSWNKLLVTAAYQSFKTQYSNGIGASAVNGVNLNSVGATAGQLTGSGAIFAPQMTSDKQTYAGATYDFGILKAYLQWSGRKVQNDTTYTGSVLGAASATTVAGQQFNRTAQQIGVRSYITPTIEAWASAGNGKFTGPIGQQNPGQGVTPGSVSFVAYQLGSNYYLSKRTNLYAIYGQQQSSSATAGVTGSGNTANQYALGLRHTF